jgi:uncharacterized lipoprotein YmbA
MRPFNFAATVFALGALVLFQAGCLGPGKSPPTRFYVLSTLAEMETDPSPVADLSDVAIGVGPVRIPGKLDRPQIIVRSSRNEVRLMELAEWGDPLAPGFARALAENLALLLKTEKVSIFPWLKATRRDYQVTVDVIDFIGAPGEDAHLRAWWSVFGNNGKIELIKRYAFLGESVAGDNIAALVEAQSRLVAALSRRVAESIHLHSQKTNDNR